MRRVEAARRFAERVHEGALDRYGEPLLDHVRRVAAAVPPEARVVAWLHETLELAPVTPEQLAGCGASGEEIAAVQLLTRAPDVSARAYLAHVARIAAAPGRAGGLARIVKVADLRDRLENRPAAPPAEAAWPPHDAALSMLAPTRIAEPAPLSGTAL